MPDIVLRDRNGNHLNFYGAEYLDAVFPDGTEIPYAAYDPETLTPENLASGVTVGDVVGTMSAPILLEDLPIELDFSGGNQSVAAPDGYAVKNAIIQQPATLIPENIAEGVDIAGIIGTLAGGNSVKTATGSATGNGDAVTVTHGMGVTPDIVIVVCMSGVTSSDTSYYLDYAIGYSTALKTLSGFSKCNYGYKIKATGIEPFNFGSCIDGTTANLSLKNANPTTFQFGSVSGGTAPSKKNGSYTWYAIGGLT